MFSISGQSDGDYSNREMNRRQWRRVLYESQPFPDNFFDRHKFFDQLDMSSSGKQAFSYFATLLGASVIVQQLSIVAIFLAIYKYIVVFELSVQVIFVLDCVLLGNGFFLQRILNANTSSPNPPVSIRQAFQAVFLFAVCLRVAAPALQTLTSSFSEDTVHALTIAFSVLHLVSYDYKTLEEASDASAGTLSLNASMFTAVLLASRLNNIEMVFAFMLLAVILFSFLPSISRMILQHSVGMHLAFTLFVSLFACALLYYLDFTLFIIYELWVVFISTVCPLWLMKMQIFKKALKGPWDIATL